MSAGSFFDAAGGSMYSSCVGGQTPSVRFLHDLHFGPKVTKRGRMPE
jgi:hypothetical protein